MGFADLHIHSVYSYDGVVTVPAILKHVADQTDLNVIAITDHDDIRSICEAQDLAPKYGIEVIPGCEVSTADGHLLCLFIDRPVQPGMALIDTVKAVGDMGGICIAAHPTARGTSSLSFESIEQALKSPESEGIFVGIEAYNGGLIYHPNNKMVFARSQQYPLAQVGNSDAHTLQIIGNGSTEFEGHTARELRAALENRQTKIRKTSGASGVEILLGYLPRFMMRKMGWVPWNVNPDQPVVHARLAAIPVECR